MFKFMPRRAFLVVAVLAVLALLCIVTPTPVMSAAIPADQASGTNPATITITVEVPEYLALRNTFPRLGTDIVQAVVPIEDLKVANELIYGSASGSAEKSHVELVFKKAGRVTAGEPLQMLDNTPVERPRENIPIPTNSLSFDITGSVAFALEGTKVGTGVVTAQATAVPDIAKMTGTSSASATVYVVDCNVTNNGRFNLEPKFKITAPTNSATLTRNKTFDWNYQRLGDPFPDGTHPVETFTGSFTVPATATNTAIVSSEHTNCQSNTGTVAFRLKTYLNASDTLVGLPIYAPTPGGDDGTAGADTITVHDYSGPVNSFIANPAVTGTYTISGGDTLTAPIVFLQKALTCTHTNVATKFLQENTGELVPLYTRSGPPAEGSAIFMQINGDNDVPINDTYGTDDPGDDAAQTVSSGGFIPDSKVDKDLVPLTLNDGGILAKAKRGTLTWTCSDGITLCSGDGKQCGAKIPFTFDENNPIEPKATTVYVEGKTVSQSWRPAQVTATLIVAEEKPGFSEGLRDTYIVKKALTVHDARWVNALCPDADAAKHGHNPGVLRTCDEDLRPNVAGTLFAVKGVSHWFGADSYTYVVDGLAVSPFDAPVEIYVNGEPVPADAIKFRPGGVGTEVSYADPTAFKQAVRDHWPARNPNYTVAFHFAKDMGTDWATLAGTTVVVKAVNCLGDEASKTFTVPSITTPPAAGSSVDAAPAANNSGPVPNLTGYLWHAEVEDADCRTAQVTPGPECWAQGGNIFRTPRPVLFFDIDTSTAAGLGKMISAWDAQQISTDELHIGHKGCERALYPIDLTATPKFVAPDVGPPPPLTGILPTNRTEFTQGCFAVPGQAFTLFLSMPANLPSYGTNSIKLTSPSSAGSPADYVLYPIDDFP